MRANEIFSDKNFEIVFSPVKLFVIWKKIFVILNETFFLFFVFWTENCKFSKNIYDCVHFFLLLPPEKIFFVLLSKFFMQKFFFCCW